MTLDFRKVLRQDNTHIVFGKILLAEVFDLSADALSDYLSSTPLSASFSPLSDMADRGATIAELLTGIGISWFGSPNSSLSPNGKPLTSSLRRKRVRRRSSSVHSVSSASSLSSAGGPSSTMFAETIGSPVMSESANRSPPYSSVPQRVIPKIPSRFTRTGVLFLFLFLSVSFFLNCVFLFIKRILLP